MQHIDYIRRCIQIAEQGIGWVNPNPMVGSVIVHNGNIIAEGFHERLGADHAERMAINRVEDKEILKESTLYVSLEPCSHFGRTPPCADLIIESQIPRVVVATTDPNPLVCGNGIQKLRNAGIEVTVGILEEEAVRLNKFFNTYHQKHRPFFIAKWAETHDGYMATLPKTNAFFSGEDTRELTHKLRKEVSGVLVGLGTWEIDRPQLTDRIFGGPQPIRIVLDPDLKGSYIHVENEEVTTWVITKEVHAQKGNVYIWAVGDYLNDLSLINQFLYEKGVNSVLIEGGAPTLTRFINEGMVDELYQFKHRSLMWGHGVQAPNTRNFRKVNHMDFKESELSIYEY